MQLEVQDIQRHIQSNSLSIDTAILSERMGLTCQQFHQTLQQTTRLLSEDFTKAFLKAVVELKIEAGVFGIFKESELNTGSGLLEYIEYFNYTPVNNLHLSIADYVKIFSWLDELRMYHNQAGKLSEIANFNNVFKFNPAAGEEDPNYRPEDGEDDYF